ncbi:HAD-IB family hydrolase [Shewanella eurypsychrophilus]|uniref:HAD-IB family hydrolase n=1 Tax=Shewanella eurypsychrophilus TaxID=2593656 RepID=A0ABX6V1K8_9GAMM|nr:MULTISPECIES: HAD-IB family hydrolase [Shewanella]QFU21189.1 HAD-IB family hydrolase [Shewanella sp. YLB-09]QPG56480.1 HAD-IB family hydrolase [Shewanella eurypsychrophilus]
MENNQPCLALFDFDGTITHSDMFSKFIRHSAKKRRFIIWGSLILPFFVAYKAGLFPARVLRPMVAYIAFKGRSVKQLESLGAYYAQHIIPLHLRDIALDKIRWHLSRGDKAVLVSASLDIYLRSWCDAMEISLICSEMESLNGHYSGRYLAGDCSGDKKANKVKAQFTLADYPKVYAYGDTHEDLSMLALADEAYMNWKRLN